MTAVLLILVMTGFGMWGFLRSWRWKVETQLKLDRCIAKTALNLAERQARLRTMNREIDALRLALSAATLTPQAKPALLAALQIEVVRQDLELLRWNAVRAQWLAQRGCGGRPAKAIIPLPSLGWQRSPPDPIGPKGLRWIGRTPEFHLEISNPPRYSAARVQMKGDDVGIAGTQEIQVGWTHPKTRPFGAWRTSLN